MSDYDKLAREAWNVWDLDHLMAGEPNEITAAKITARVAAAIRDGEERGRRRGVEMLTAIEPRLRSALHTMQGPVSDMEKRCHTDKPHNHNWMAALRFALKTLTEIHGEIAALAPRDSGKETP